MNRYFALSSADLVVPNQEAWHLLWDFSTLREIIDSLPGNSSYVLHGSSNLVWYFLWGLDCKTRHSSWRMKSWTLSGVEMLLTSVVVANWPKLFSVKTGMTRVKPSTRGINKHRYGGLDSMFSTVWSQCSDTNDLLVVVTSIRHGFGRTASPSKK